MIRLFPQHGYTSDPTSQAMANSQLWKELHDKCIKELKQYSPDMLEKALIYLKSINDKGELKMTKTIIAVFNGEIVKYKLFEGDVSRDIEKAVDLDEGLLAQGKASYDNFRNVMEGFVNL